MAIYKYYIGDKNSSIMSEKNFTLLLDLSGSASQSVERWHKRKCAFEYYTAGKGISNTCKKMPQLLHFTRMDVQDIFQDLQDPGPIPETGEDAYKIAFCKLDNFFYFWVEENIPNECHVSWQMALLEGETSDQFMVQLQKQLSHWNVGTDMNDSLWGQFIEK